MMFFVMLVFSPSYIPIKGAELTRTWVETSSYFLSIVKFGICWASIFASNFSTFVRELLMTVASKCFYMPQLVFDWYQGAD